MSGPGAASEAGGGHAPDALDVATFGEAMVLLVADEPGPLDAAQRFHKRTAGAETNVAVGLARLGLRVGWASRLGDDSLGRYLLDAMRAEGIDCSRVDLTPEASTGLMLKGRVTDGSDPPIEYHRRGSAASRMTADALDAAWLAGARHLHVTGVFPALSAGCLALAERAIACMRGARRTVSFDPNLRPALWATRQQMCDTLNALAVQCDCVLPGLDEGRALTGQSDPALIARFYRDRGVPRVIVKLGAQGAYFDDARAGCGHVPAFPVARVVDTVGAGDGFAVGVISAALEDLDVAEAARRGAWIGAQAVQAIGDTEGLPTRAQLAAAGL